MEQHVLPFLCALGMQVWDLGWFSCLAIGIPNVSLYSEDWLYSRVELNPLCVTIVGSIRWNVCLCLWVVQDFACPWHWCGSGDRTDYSLV